MNARLSARAIAADVLSGRLSAEAAAQESLNRIAAYDAIQPQTWITKRKPADVLAAARLVDARIKAGETPPLAGATFAVKDNIDVAGTPTTAGCPSFAYAPSESAEAVARLEAAGAVNMGKTNLDQFATGLAGTRSPYGAPACVFNRDYISGGSSSGSSVSVAAGLVAFALGTDTAGSGRVPAAFNHLIGLKPTKGRWSTIGLVPACRSLDCISVFTTTAADAALVDSVLSGFDERDEFSREAQALSSIEKAAPVIGVPPRQQLNFYGDEQSAALFAAAIERIKAIGAKIIEVDIAPLSAAAQLLYQGPWIAERTAAVESLLATNPGAIHPVVRAIVQAGAGVSGVEAFRGQYRLKRYERAAGKIWGQIDFLLLPTTPTIYRIAELLAEPVALNSNLGIYTNFVNLLDMSAIALPAGFRDNNTGFGVTFIGPAWADEALLEFAVRYETVFHIDHTPPLDMSARTETVQVAVVGAHLAGMPLHHQLTSRNARFVRMARTAPVYKLYAMTKTTPIKPALAHVGDGGASIELEIYELDMHEFGSFTVEVPAPLAIGTVRLDDGADVKGFVAEPRALIDSQDITHLGGWRAFIQSRDLS